MQPVCNDKQCFLWVLLEQRLKERALRQAVGERRGFVEHQNRRVGKQCPCDRQALALAAR